MTSTAMHELVHWDQPVGRVAADMVSRGMPEWLTQGVGVRPAPEPTSFEDRLDAEIAVAGARIDPMVKATNTDEREEFLVSVAGKPRRTRKA
jgi:hypothetical protein